MNVNVFADIQEVLQRAGAKKVLDRTTSIGVQTPVCADVPSLGGTDTDLLLTVPTLECPVVVSTVFVASTNYDATSVPNSTGN